ncbi:hypothetical protein [Vibrio phage MZH0603]|nr:hypothetical protein [Vibrio phage MZH0603]
MNACEPGLQRFIKQTNNTEEPVEVSSLIGGENYYSDFLWLAEGTLPKERIVRFACDVALINIELIKPYTEQFDLIVGFLNNPDANTDAVVDAVDAAVDAADADADATDVNAAYAAAYAAYAAACAAATDDTATDDAATAVANTADAADSEEKVDQLLIEMFN